MFVQGQGDVHGAQYNVSHVFVFVIRGSAASSLCWAPWVRQRSSSLMEPGLRKVAEQGQAMGIKPEVLNHLRPHILARAQELATLA